MTRFRPTRAGIVNLWDYARQEFQFHNGWLVLRGANGSGKTKALEVLFPFVLDGRLDPRRLDPFSGRERTMRENLLYRGDESMLGYAWLELQRPDAEGPRTVTVGVGMRAQKAQSGVETWFFVSDRGPIGGDWDVLDEEGRPRTRSSLAELLGAEAVRRKAEEHRRAVDQALFGLGPERFEGMLDLVLTLRRPQLAKDLDPDSLEAILREGLRPVDPELVAQAARAFDDLEAGQREVQQLREADELVQRSAEQYRRYLRTMAAERSRAVIEAEDQAQRARAVLAEAAERKAAAEQAEQETTGGLAVLDRVHSDLDADLRACQASEAYRAAGTLDDKRRLVEDRRQVAALAQAELQRAIQDMARATQRHKSTRGTLAEARVELRRALELANQEAGAAGIPTLGSEDLEQIQTASRARLQARRVELDRCRKALDGWRQAAQERDRAARKRTEAEDAVESARIRLGEAEAETGRARQALQEALAGWWTALPAELLDPADHEALGALAAVEEPAPLGPALQQRLASRREELAAAEQDLVHQLGVLDRERATLVEERARIAAEQDDAPPAPPRRETDRADQLGAPLWRLVRFREGVSTEVGAAVEAALEAAGLLDAWVQPQPGEPGARDSFLSPGPPLSDHLGSLLEPETAFPGPPPVDLARTEAVLASIGLASAGQGEGETSVGSDGSFHLSLLSGAAGASAARYIGASTREARRRQRLAVLDERLSDLALERTALEARCQALAERKAAWQRAVQALPAVEPVNRARKVELAAASVLDERRRLASEAALQLDHAVQAQGQAHRNLLRVAADCRLPPDEPGLITVEAAVKRFDEAARELVLRAQRQGSAAAAEHDAASGLQLAAEGVEARRERTQEAEDRLASIEQEFATLEATLGAEAKEILARIEVIERELGANEARRKEARADLKRAEGARGAAREEQIRAELGLATKEQVFVDALAAVSALADAELAELIGAEPALARAAEAAALARAAEAAALLAADEAQALLALARGLHRATEELSPSPDRLKSASTQVDNAHVALLQGLPPELGRASRLDVGGIARLTVHDSATDLALGAFARNLARRVEQQAELLSVRERQLLEDTLLAGLATQIQDRTHAARQLVREMDAQMRARRLSSGQTVGIAWGTDEGLSESDRQALALLAQDPALIGADGLARLRAHFAERIKARRAEQGGPAGLGYRDILAHALDYRRWHRLRLRLYERDGSSQPLTPARHARLSGGEKAATLHLPLFAAALARFSGGRADCPRLLALDEAFAGIDDTGRPELLGLAAAFDLDLFMTGYDLWAVGPQVPAAAHYELLHLREAHEVVALQVDWSQRD